MKDHQDLFLEQIQDYPGDQVAPDHLEMKDQIQTVEEVVLLQILDMEERH